MTCLRSKVFRPGFTLVELMIVIAILAVVAAAAYATFGSAEKSASSAIGKTNATNIQKTIRDFKSLYGVYPSAWHTGLNTAATASVEGLSLQTALNMAVSATGTIASTAITNNYTKGFQVATPGTNIKALTAGEIKALRENGIHQLAANGYAPVSDATGTAAKNDLAATLKAWVLTNAGATGPDLFRGGSAVMQADFSYAYTIGTTPVTLDGKKFSEIAIYGDAVILVFCTKEVGWSTVFKGDANASGSGEYLKMSDLQFDTPPKNPGAMQDSVFPYYIAAFYLSPSMVGNTAGYSCKLLGVLDGDLNPVNE